MSLIFYNRLKPVFREYFSTLGVTYFTITILFGTFSNGLADLARAGRFYCSGGIEKLSIY